MLLFELLNLSTSTLDLYSQCLLAIKQRYPTIASNVGYVPHHDRVLLLVRGSSSRVH